MPRLNGGEMAGIRAKVSEKYQVQIPKGIRKELRIERGDRLFFRTRGKMLVVEVEKLPRNPVANIVGIARGADLAELKSKAAKKLAKHKLGLK
jgi:AbrB family looped-hinge helix DNA binding protein